MAGLQSLDVHRPGVWFSHEEGYVYSLDEVIEVIEEYERATMSRFVVYSSNACFSNVRGMVSLLYIFISLGPVVY
jgi:hypothetical protein